MPWAIGQIVRVSFYFKMGAFRACSTRYHRVTATNNGGPGPGVAAARFMAVYQPLLTAALNQQATLDGCILQDYLTGLTFIEGGVAVGAGTGTGSVDPLPPAVSGLIRLQGQASGRPRAGRMYIPFPGKDDNDGNGLPTAAYRTILDAICTQLLGTVTATDLGPLPPFPARTATFQAILAPFTFFPAYVAVATSSPAWATQRRRATAPYDLWYPF